MSPSEFYQFAAILGTRVVLTARLGLALPEGP